MLLVLRFFLNALALLLVAQLFSGIYLRGLGAALIAVLVLGLVNTLIRPIILLLTLPLTILTLGLFTLVINALMLKLTAAVVPGFAVSGAWAALGGALVYSLFTTVINWFLGW